MVLVSFPNEDAENNGIIRSKLAAFPTFGRDVLTKDFVHRKVAPTSLSPNFCAVSIPNPVTLCASWRNPLENNQLGSAFVG